MGEAFMALARFRIGRTVATPGALEAIARAGEMPLPYLARHVGGDWGDLDQDDKAANESAVRDGLRILSAYRLADDTRIWVISPAGNIVDTLDRRHL
jgi:hypothetical protein